MKALKSVGFMWVQGLVGLVQFAHGSRRDGGLAPAHRCPARSFPSADAFRVPPRRSREGSFPQVRGGTSVPASRVPRWSWRLGRKASQAQDGKHRRPHVDLMQKGGTMRTRYRRRRLRRADVTDAVALAVLAASAATVFLLVVSRL